MTDHTTDVASEEQPTQSGHKPERRPGMLHRSLHAHPVLSLTTKIVVAVVGTLVTAIGVVMIVTPGPAFVLIPLGLAILSTEFEFARRWLRWARAKAEEAKRKSDESTRPYAAGGSSSPGSWCSSWSAPWPPMSRSTTGRTSPSAGGTGCRAWSAGCRPPRDVRAGPMMR